jgi:acyl-CoA synthetase (AMP-forming)/AMP-acid ligase II
MWLSNLLERHRCHARDRVAITDDKGDVTYGELATRCDAVAARIRRLGVGKGDRVLVLSRNRSEALESYIALTRAGAVAVPINHALVADEVRYVTDLTNAVGAVGESELLDRAVHSSALRFVWDFDSPEYHKAANGPTATPPSNGSIDEPAAILCTSATTGLPKGVVLTHRALQFQALAWLASTGHGSEVTYLAAPPVFHSTVTVALAYLAGGARVVLTRKFTPQRCVELIAAERVTHAYLVPSMISYLMRAASVDKTDMSSLREIFHGAAPMTAAQRQAAARALKCHLRDCYGQAEAGGPITLGEPLGACEEPPAQPRWQSAGRPLLGFELKVVDGDDVPVVPGALGEICVRSSAIMRGYWENAEASANAIQYGWLHTGDVGALTDDGELVIVDRLTDVIIRGGQNVYPAEIERVLCQHPSVAEAAVIGVPDGMLGEQPVAYVVPVEGGPDLGDVLAFVGTRMASFKRPSQIDLIDELPRNPAGKVLKRSLRERAAAALSA